MSYYIKGLKSYELFFNLQSKRYNVEKAVKLLETDRKNAVLFFFCEIFLKNEMSAQVSRINIHSE